MDEYNDMSGQLGGEDDFDALEAGRKADLIKEAKERYKICQDAWHEHTQKTRKVLKFFAGEQWDPQLKNNREQAGLPALTVNKLPAFLRQITNEVRQNTPSIQIDPHDDETSQETAEILSGLIKTIESESDADAAYDTGVENAALTGMGFIRVMSEYDGADSFDQKLVVRPVFDMEKVLIDPQHLDIAGADMDYAFVTTSLSKETYKRLYANTELGQKLKMGAKSWSSDWVREDEVLIVEYFYKSYEEKLLKLVFNTIKNETFTTTDELDPEGVADGTLQVLQVRSIQSPIIRWAKLTDGDVLEETTWPGDYIPLIVVKGDEHWVENKRIVKGAVEDAIDSQRAFNYFFSVQAEMTQLAPKSPFIAEARQIANYEHLWRDANVSNLAVLPYNNVDGVAPPMRQQAEPPIQAAGTLMAEASDNIKSIFGIFDASLGAQGNETSGKAILARQQQAHTTNYHFYDNLNRSIAQVGRVLLQAIPKFYDQTRQLITTKIDGKKELVWVNKINPSTGELEHDLTKGKFNVVVEAGASYATKRQEAVESMITLGQAYPNALPVMADLMVGNMDWPGAKQIAARLKAIVPPNVLQATEEMNPKDAEAMVPQLKQQLQQANQSLEALNAHAQQVENELKNMKEELHLEKLNRSIELKKVQDSTDLKVSELQLTEQQTELEFYLEREKIRLEREKLALQRMQLEIAAAQAASNIVSDVHDREMERMEHGQTGERMEVVAGVSNPDLGSPDIDLGGDLGRNGV